MKLSSIFNLSGGANGNESRHTALKSTVSEYAQKSTIHGVAYVGDDERNKFERIWWFVMLVCSIFGACYLIYQAYRTMKENPIIESPSLTRTPMWEVPFPAVTICPVPQFELTTFALNKSNWPDFAHSLLPDNLTELNIDGGFLSSFILQAILLRRSDQNNYDILAKVFPAIQIGYASFGTYPKFVDVPLQKTITYIGACVTLNMYREKDLLRDGHKIKLNEPFSVVDHFVHQKRKATSLFEFSVILSSLNDASDKTEQLWSRDSGFIKNLPLANYTNPFRSFGPDDLLAVGFDVNNSKRFKRFLSRCLVSFHAPDEVPLFNRHSEIVTIILGENEIELAPHLVVSEGVEHYRPEIRQCYFSNERYLRFYKNYTQNHCEIECLANYTLAKCGCIPYHLPHFNDTKLCTTDFKCFDLEATQFYLPEFKDNAEQAPIDDCNCLPTCTQLSYKPVLSSSIKGDDDATYFLVRNKYPYIKKQIRTELHSISEFFSNCGGSLGLFLGVSTFSILELLYFCTVRLYLHCKKRSPISNE